MLQGIFAAAWIECITICQKWSASQLLYHICHCLRIIRAKIADIPKLSKMHLNGSELIVHINLANSRSPDQLFQLGGKPFTWLCPKIRIINF